MKRLFVVIVAAAAAYSGWWFYAAHDMRQSVDAWFADQRVAGWEAGYADMSVRGFPSRTDVTLTDVNLRAPDGSFEWDAPFFQVFALSYRRGHIIVAWPDMQTVTTPDGPVEIISDGLRASVIHADGLIMRSNVEADVLNLAGPEDSVALAGINLAMEKIEPSPAEYRLAVSVDSIARSDPIVTGSLAPEAFASLRADTKFNLTEPLTRDVFSDAAPELQAVSVRNTQVNYGTLTLKLAGEAEFDAQGRATGEVTFEAENWRESLEAARTNGDLPAELSNGLIDLLSMVASISGGRETLDITLGLNRGTVLLGPLPIGQLPPLSWP